MKNLLKQTKGITLIALVITIIVLLILAGVTIVTLTGENGILTKATNAKEKTELAGLKEQVELEILNLNINQDDFTSSEVIDKLVENGILKSDRTTFADNNNYSLSTNGNILYNGNSVETIELTNNVSSLEVDCGSSSPNVIGTRIITCKDGIVQYANPNTDDKAYFKIIANNPPNGKKFAYWVDKYNNIVSYYSNFSLVTNDDNTYTAVYVNEEENVTKTECINIYYTTQTLGESLSFQSCFVSNPDNLATSARVGVLATNNEALASESELVVESTDPQIKNAGREFSVEEYEIFCYTLTKNNAGTDTWYNRGFATLTYSDGSTKTIYSGIISVHR